MPQIGRDLAERNKQVTLEKLKESGESYKQFNKNLMVLLGEEADDNCEQDGEARHFKRQLEQIESAEYFDKKYNLDYQILKKFKQETREALGEQAANLREEASERRRKREEKAQEKDLLKKYM